MADAVFLTGATGFLGTEMVYELVSTVSSPVYVLVRANSKEEAIHRLKASWYPIPDLYNNSQLIVGSAPISEALLLNFRALFEHCQRGIDSEFKGEKSRRRGSFCRCH